MLLLFPRCHVRPRWHVTVSTFVDHRLVTRFDNRSPLTTHILLTTILLTTFGWPCVVVADHMLLTASRETLVVHQAMLTAAYLEPEPFRFVSFRTACQE
jgi:hypothetical protein